MVTLRSAPLDGSSTASVCSTGDSRPSIAISPLQRSDRSVTITFDSSLVLRDARPRTRPCGYWLAADQGEAVTRLRGLGVRVERFSEAFDLQADVNTGAPVRGEREILEFSAPAGSYYVPLSQPWGQLVVAALEPDSAAGLLAGKVVTAPNKLRKVTVVPKVRRTLVP